MPGILVFSEKDDVAQELVSKARELKGAFGGAIAAMITGKGDASAAQLFSCGAGVVFSPETPSGSADASAISKAIAQLASSHGLDLVLIGSTRAGKEIASMAAHWLEAGCVTDATDVKVQDGATVVDRYTLGGATVSSLVIKTQKKVIAVMPKTFQRSPQGQSTGQMVTFAMPVSLAPSNLIQKQDKVGESTPIEDAETLVCVGRGLNNQKDIPVIEGLAKAMKAEIGCTRPLTHDWQWFPESREVGLSGKKCKPSLCLSVGISGQIQHTVGIRNSRIIAAVNKDKNAPIFKTADYGLVADLYDVVPRLTAKILALSK